MTSTLAPCRHQRGMRPSRREALAHHLAPPWLVLGRFLTAKRQAAVIVVSFPDDRSVSPDGPHETQGLSVGAEGCVTDVLSCNTMLLKQKSSWAAMRCPWNRAQDETSRQQRRTQWQTRRWCS